MGYTARILEVMIASPSDVVKERNLIRDIVHTWNAIHAKRMHIVLMPVGWETHSAPAMGDRPQGILNKQLLDDADILVAAFWTRIGSHTGTAISGTVEEICRHVEAGKPAMLYFSSTPVQPGSIDLEQYQALCAFREECKTKGLYETYESLEEFKEKFNRQLATTINTLVADGHPFEMDIDEEGTTDELGGIIAALSQEAKQLIAATATSPDGTILKVAFSQGLVIQTNSHNFVEEGNKRSEALWKSALNSLVENELVEAEGYKGEVYSMTDLGYRVADRIGQIDSIGAPPSPSW